MADAEPEQEARPVWLALGLDRREKVVDRLVLPALAPDQLLTELVQPEDVSGRMQPAELDELRYGLLAEPLDVERTARHEMPEPLEALGRADEAAGAADVDLAFLGDGLALAFGAMVGKDIGVTNLVTGEVLNHLRDDVAGALNTYAVADSKA